MGLFDLVDSFFEPSADGGFGTSIMDLGANVLGGFAQNVSMGNLAAPVYQSNYPQTMPQAYPVSAGSVPMAARAAAAGIASWSVRYPALWQALQRMRAQGTAGSINKLWSMLKQWGPTSLSTVIGAAAVADLISYRTTHKRRRMNPANTRALRRSLRRLKSFDNLSRRVSGQLGSTCRTKKRRSC